jgi:hypothetical protein
MATKHDRALASFLVGLDDVVEELSVVSDPQRSGELVERLMAMGAQLKRLRRMRLGEFRWRRRRSIWVCPSRLFGCG